MVSKKTHTDLADDVRTRLRQRVNELNGTLWDAEHQLVTILRRNADLPPVLARDLEQLYQTIRRGMDT